MNYEQGFKHAVPPEKNGYVYITKLITRQISPAASVRVCVRVWKRGGWGEKGDCPLLEPIKSQNCKIPPAHELRKKEKLMVSY